MELRNRKLSTDSPPPSKTRSPPRQPQPPPTPSSSTTDKPKPTYSTARIIAGWLVHLYTATGLLVNMYSLLYALFAEIPNFELFAKLNWLAILIDATDGTFARAVDVKKVVPGYDGALLDNIIDYQTFALLPALAVVRFGLVQGDVLRFMVAAVVLLSSAYAFCQTTAKTDEAFVGFPSYWNIVVFYVYYLKCRTWVTVAVFVACGVLSFIPVHFIYPTRTEAYFRCNLGGAYAWSALMLVPTFWGRSRYALWALYTSFLYVIYYTGMSLYLDHKRRSAEAAKQE